MESILNKTAIASSEIKPNIYSCAFTAGNTLIGAWVRETLMRMTVRAQAGKGRSGGTPLISLLEKAILLCFRWIRWVVEADCEYGFQDIANFTSVGFYLSGRNWLVGMNGIVLRTLHHLLLESQSQSSRRARNVAHMSENTIATRKLVAVSSSPYSAALCIRMPCLFEKLHCYRTRI